MSSIDKQKNYDDFCNLCFEKTSVLTSRIMMDALFQMGIHTREASIAMGTALVRSAFATIGSSLQARGHSQEETMQIAREKIEKIISDYIPLCRESFDGAEKAIKMLGLERNDSQQRDS